MTWGNTTAKCRNKIQIQQNYLIKIISNAPWTKTKLSSLCEQLHLLKLNNIYQLEVLKFSSVARGGGGGFIAPPPHWHVNQNAK